MQAKAMMLDSGVGHDYYTFKEASIRLTIEDPYGVQQTGGSGSGGASGENGARARSEIQPNVIGNCCWGYKSTLSNKTELKLKKRARLQN